ncbi:MAG: mechanosensitive ion channel family protein [Novosphingobium sp.]|nr:mechanosensitive ion channel family protein [Novosphingobium sp.]
MNELSALSDSIADWLSDHAGRIALAVGTAALIVALLLGVKRLLLRAASRIGGDRAWPALVAGVIRKTRLWFLAALAARLVQGYADPPEVVAQTIAFLFVVAATFQAAIWAKTFALGLIERRAAARGDDAQLASAMTIIRVLVSFAIFAIAAVFVLDNLGVDVTGLVAGLGIGGIAIGLAAQGIFRDLFAAIAILFDRPFHVGDAITFPSKDGRTTGTVETIGLKSTRVRGQTGELWIIANAKLLEQELTNLTDRRFHRMTLPVGAAQDTDPEQAAAIPAILREAAEQAGQRFVRANFVRFGENSLDYELVFDCDSGGQGEAKAAFDMVALALYRLLRERGVELASPP